MKTKIRAYRSEDGSGYANADAWEMYITDESRLWSVVTDHNTPREHYHAKQPKYWTPQLFIVWQCLQRYWQYDERITPGEAVYAWSGAWDTPEGREADAALVNELTGTFERSRIVEHYDALLDVFRRHAGGDERSDRDSRCLKTWCEYAAEALSLLTDNPYSVREIRGCCQGDCAEVVIPTAELSSVLEIEARFFWLGTEWVLQSDADECHAYTWLYGDDETRQLREAARDYGLVDSADDADIIECDYNDYESIDKRRERIEWEGRQAVRERALADIIQWAQRIVAGPLRMLTDNERQTVARALVQYTALT